MLELMIIYAEYDLEFHNFFTKNFGWENKRINDLVSKEYVICLNTAESLKKARERFDEIRTIRYSSFEEEIIEIIDFQNNKKTFKNVRVCGEYIRREPIDKIFKDVNVYMLREKMSAEDYLLYEAQFNEFGINIVPEKQYINEYELHDMTLSALRKNSCNLEEKGNEFIFIVNGQSIDFQRFIMCLNDDLEHEIAKYNNLIEKRKQLLDENGQVTKELKEKLAEIEEIFKKMLAK